MHDHDPERMRAITGRHGGAADLLSEVKVTRPAPGPTEVLGACTPLVQPDRLEAACGRRPRPLERTADPRL